MISIKRAIELLDYAHTIQLSKEQCQAIKYYLIKLQEEVKKNEQL